MRVAAIQMVSGQRLQDNLARARTLLEQAAQAGAELAVLPEYFCLLAGRDEDKLAIRETPGEGPIQQTLAEAARELGIWLVGGTQPMAAASAGAGSPDRLFNTTLVYTPQGHCHARYDKIHLFRFDNGQEQYDEARLLDRGKERVLFELPSRDGHRWRIGLSVCYDLRFPELYRDHARDGADLMLVPSAFTYTTGQAHWEVLLRARAIENLAYVAAAAQGGVHDGGRRTWGHSMVVDPWGVVLAERQEGEAVVVADLEVDRLRDCRARLPALEHRVL